MKVLATFNVSGIIFPPSVNIALSVVAILFGIWFNYPAEVCFISDAINIQETIALLFIFTH